MCHQILGFARIKALFKKVAVVNFSSIAFKILIKVTIPMPLSVTIVIIIMIIVAMHRSQFTCTLSVTIAKHQYPKTTLTGLAVDRIHAYICIYNSKYFIQSENSFSHIFIDHMLLDFWCAFDILKIKSSENGFSSKSGNFLCIIITDMC